MQPTRIEVYHADEEHDILWRYRVTMSDGTVYSGIADPDDFESDCPTDFVVSLADAMHGVDVWPDDIFTNAEERYTFWSADLVSEEVSHV